MALKDWFKGRSRGRRAHEPKRETVPNTDLFKLLNTWTGKGNKSRPVPKPTPNNLRYFARTPVARKAINTIKNPISLLDWEIVPRKGLDITPELQRQIDVATTAFETPNDDDSLHTLMEQVIEDILVGAGAIEVQPSGDPERPVWLWPVDGLSIQVYPDWQGHRDQVRYAQVLGWGQERIDLRNDELIYIRPNPNTTTVFGVGALEVAFNDVARLLGIGDFAGNVASNQRSSIAIDLGNIPQATIDRFRVYWENEIEGQGKTPIIGFAGNQADKSGSGIAVHRLYPEGDGGLFLKYQEFLIRIIANAFGISPQNLGIEADVNRNTSEVAEDRDWNMAIKPMARLIASHITREVLWQLLGFVDLRFVWKGIDREDEEATSKINETYYKTNVLTPNEIREKLGMKQSTNPFADMTFADTQVALNAARGAGVVDDPSLEKDNGEGSKAGNGSGGGSRGGGQKAPGAPGGTGRTPSDPDPRGAR